jgi:hypothetical protein
VTWGELPRSLTLGGSKLPYSLGPIYLLAPLALAGLLWPGTRFLAIAMLAVGAAYVGSKDPRFLIPVLPLLSLLMGVVLRRLPAGQIILVLLIAAQLVLSWPSVLERLHSPQTPMPTLASTSWKIALRREPEELYLSGFDEYLTARQIETHVPRGETMLALAGGAAQSYTTRFILDSYHSAIAETAADFFYANESWATDARWRWTAVFPNVRTRQVQIIPIDKGSAIWSVNEVQLLDSGRPLLPGHGWRWDTDPNPWDAVFLCDRRIATRWRSWESVHPAMRIDVRTDTSQSIDGVEVLSGNAPWETKLDARILDDDGHWRAPISVQWHADPPVDLRKDATQALKRQGIRYVLISANAWRAQAFRGDPSGWGMHELVSTRNATLYEID